MTGRKFYVDESGFTGEDLLSAEQPIFVQSTTDFETSEANEIIKSIFAGVDARELKHSRLMRNAKHQDRIVELVKILSKHPKRCGTWIAHKEFALVTLIVDWWVEPLAHRSGFNLYKDGANLGMANMLYFCLEGFWGNIFRRKLLVHFQQMFRTRSREKFDSCEKLIRKKMGETSDLQSETLRYLWPSFNLLGISHVHGLPSRALDIALPGLIFISHQWKHRHPCNWDVVHDQSSNMAKQQWLWDALTSPNLPEAHFPNPSGTATYPLNINSIAFADSTTEQQLQICDLLAGATSFHFRYQQHSGKEGEYSDKLFKAGIQTLVMGGMWPSTDVTPEALGMKGWDGNVAIEWLGKNIRPHPPR